MEEIVLSSAEKPYLEWINDRIVPKALPTTRHSMAQTAFMLALANWCEARRSGFSGPEITFQIKPPGEIRRTLVPDVAYISFERFPREEFESSEAIFAAPEVVVEIRSAEDRQEDIDEKVRVYLAAGTHVVFLADPETRTVMAFDHSGMHDLSVGPISHEALPGFWMEQAELFDFPRSRRR